MIVLQGIMLVVLTGCAAALAITFTYLMCMGMWFLATEIEMNIRQRGDNNV